MINKLGIEDVKTGKEVICDNIFDASNEDFFEFVDLILRNSINCKACNKYRVTLLINFIMGCIGAKENIPYGEVFEFVQDLFFEYIDTTEEVLDHYFKRGE